MSEWKKSARADSLESTLSTTSQHRPQGKKGARHWGTIFLKLMKTKKVWPRHYLILLPSSFAPPPKRPVSQKLQSADQFWQTGNKAVTKKQNQSSIHLFRLPVWAVLVFCMWWCISEKWYIFVSVYHQSLFTQWWWYLHVVLFCWAFQFQYQWDLFISFSHHLVYLIFRVKGTPPPNNKSCSFIYWK